MKVKNYPLFEISCLINQIINKSYLWKKSIPKINSEAVPFSISEWFGILLYSEGGFATKKE